MSLSMKRTDPSKMRFLWILGGSILVVVIVLYSFGTGLSGNTVRLSGARGGGECMHAW